MNASCVAEPPAVTTNDDVSAGVNTGLDAARNTYVPAALTVQPAKLAWPLTTCFVSPPVHERVPGPPEALKVTTVV